MLAPRRQYRIWESDTDRFVLSVKKVGCTGSIPSSSTNKSSPDSRALIRRSRHDGRPTTSYSVSLYPRYQTSPLRTHWITFEPCTRSSLNLTPTNRSGLPMDQHLHRYLAPASRPCSNGRPMSRRAKVDARARRRRSASPWQRQCRHFGCALRSRQHRAQHHFVHRVIPSRQRSRVTSWRRLCSSLDTFYPVRSGLP